MIVTGQSVVEWVAKRTNEHGNFGCAVGIGWKRNGELVAGVAYNDFNGVNINMHVAAVGQHWLAREYLWACFDYPFNQAGVQRITGLVGEGNIAARKFDEHLGFELETTLERSHPTGRTFVYRMFREQCRWIKQDFAQRYAKAA